MKNDIKEYLESIKEGKKGFIKLLVILFFILIIPINIITINLIVLGVLLGFKVYESYFENVDIIWSDILKQVLQTVAWVSAFYLIIKYLGGYGLAGFVVIVILLAVFKVWKNWKFFKKSSNIITVRVREK